MSSLIINVEENTRHKYYENLKQLFENKNKKISDTKYTLYIPKGYHPVISHVRLCEKLLALCDHSDWEVVFLDKEAKDSELTWDTLNNKDEIVIYNGNHKKRPCLIRNEIKEGDNVQIGILRSKCFNRRNDNDEDIPFSYFISGVVVAFIFVYVAHNVGIH